MRRDEEAFLTDRRMALAREWDDLVEQVRQIDGFADFLRPPPLKTLLEAAQSGPVVIVNVSRWRCDALVVNADGVQAVPLPDLTEGEVRARTAAYLEALEGQPSGDGLGATFSERLRARAEARARREEVLRSTMEWLWDTVAQPVFNHLDSVAPLVGRERLRRIWWCPTGLLTMLPVHAAGYHGASDGRTVLDRAVSSYTPTLRALRQAREPLPPTAGEASLAFIGVPDVPDAIYLGADVARERKALAQAFPAGFTTIEGADATIDTVAAAMAKHRWIHVSCHGYQNILDPSRAGLMLTDGTLTIPRISAGRYPGEFAFLSACMTATGGVNLPDETITLAAALSYAGYRHVVATLWKVPSSVAADVTEAVYRELTATGRFEPDRTAVALHNAVLGLRNDGRPLSEWVPFVHNGP
ncbi:MAG: CHAT domain-containing protein [Micromonosporaceae bacterium]|nr:CHAT domain-containing protein [Micromonosporaceae bacterium]